MTEEEGYDDTQFYLQHARRLSTPQANDAENEAEKDQLEQAFLSLNYTKQKNVND